MMTTLVDGIVRFRSDVFPAQRALYERLADKGQSPKVLVVSCSDSRVVPELFTQSDPGDMFVTRNAGNIVPPYVAGASDAVTSAIEYAVAGLGVDHVVVCGHTDCGAMKALLNPDALADMPSVKAWLGHCQCARNVFRRAHEDGLSDKDAARVLAMENVAAQLTNLRTHPSVAARLADGSLTLHGWLFDIGNGTVLAMDEATRRFMPIDGEDALPVALPGERRAIDTGPLLVAAE